MDQSVCLIIVTHDSEAVLDRCLGAIDRQTVRPRRVVIVDSGSADPAYLERHRRRSATVIRRAANIGYAAGNNLGLSLIEDLPGALLFINPDTFLDDPACLETALQIMADRPEVAVLTGRLQGYDRAADGPTGRLDSTGIFRTWYGRWYDRGQGETDSGRYLGEQYVPAICGAFMFCRTEALLPELPEVFDESFFLYKEDIDLSLTLRKRGWKLLYTPALGAHHCRGWQPERRLVDRSLRLLAARNEIRLTVKHPTPYLVWALAKYLIVRLCHV